MVNAGQEMHGRDHLLALMRDYVAGTVACDEFCENYLEGWRSLRDSGLMRHEAIHVQRGIDIVLTAIDSFDTDTTDGQDPTQREAILRAEVRVVLSLLSP